MRAASVPLVPLAALLLALLVTPPGPLGAQDTRTSDDARWTGTWQGSLQVGPQTLPVVFHIQPGEEGLTATMDSPAQGAFGIPVARVTAEGDSLTLEISVAQARFRGMLREDGILAGTWSQGPGTLPLELERSDEDPGTPPVPDASARPQTPRCPCPYDARDVRFPNPDEGFDLAGTLTLPTGEGPFPGVVLVSGSGPQDRDETLLGHKPFAVLADHLTRRGIAVLRFDDRGVGESGGDFAAATSQDFASDVEAALDFLGAQEEVDPARIGVVGHSEGGLIAPMVASRGEGARFIVLLAGPGMPGGEILLDQSRRIASVEGMDPAAVDANEAMLRTVYRVLESEPDRESAADRLREVLGEMVEAMPPEERAAAGIPEGAEETWIETQVRQMNSPWMRFFITHDPRPALEETRVPVLALNGELDLQVPHEANLAGIRQALERGGNPDVTVRALPGLNHLFQHATTGSPTEYATIDETMSPQVMDLVAAWILERFGS